MTFNLTIRRSLLPETRKFLADWLAWVERGAPPNEPYNRSFGLCYNAMLFDPSKQVWRDLDNSFEDGFPFGADRYFEHQFQQTLHLDPNRLAFVRANLPKESPK